MLISYAKLTLKLKHSTYWTQSGNRNTIKLYSYKSIYIGNNYIKISKVIKYI